MKIGRINNNYEEERLYSTGSDELDDLLERAFCEGYEYAQREFALPSLGQIRTKIVRNTAARTARQMRKAGRYMQSPEMAKRVANVGSKSPYQNTKYGWSNKSGIINSLKEEGKGLVSDANTLVQGIQQTAPKGGNLSSGTFNSLMKDKSGWSSQLLGQRSKEAKAATSALFGKGKSAKRLDKTIVDSVTSGKY